MRRAVIDIGTNSVKLLVAVVEGDLVTPLHEASEQTRLGRKFYETRLLQPEAIEGTARAVAAFAADAGKWEAASIRVIATSAAREARNQGELLEAVQGASGWKVEVISGEQEADWAFAGVRSDPALADHSLLILDIGGGSTEFIIGHGARQVFRESFPLGTVRLMERIQVSDPPTAREWAECEREVLEFLQTEVRPEIVRGVREGAVQGLYLVATGGTPSMLAAMEAGLGEFDRETIEKTVLSFERVQARRQRLWSEPIEQRRKTPGLVPNRADVILFGVAIAEQVMRALEFRELRVSTRGLRFGAVAAGQ